MKVLHVTAVLGVLLALTGASGHFGRARYLSVVPQGSLAASGVKIEGQTVPAGTDPRAFIRALASEMLDRKIELRYDGDTILAASARDLGASIDTDWATQQALGVARRGDPYDRYVEAKAAAGGAFDVSLPVHLPSREITERLLDLKEELDEAPVAARRHVDTGEVEPHVTGRYLDAYAAAEAVVRAIRSGATAVDVAPYVLVPAATEEAAKTVDVSVILSSFETRFGGPPGRDQNIRRAAGLIDGVVLLPGEELSFNALVGARSIENGFAYAPEIYKGEIREGVGGGACQVASTLHAAAFFGGLEVLQRQNHSRPSAYIRPGLDATVSFPVLDLRIRNPFAFPVLVHGTAGWGGLRFEILGHEQPVSVDLATQTAGIFRYTRKIEKRAGLSDVKVKQRGKNGMAIKRTKTIVSKSGGTQVVISTDTYPATQEILQIPPDFDLTTLPPLPSQGAESTTAAAPSG